MNLFKRLSPSHRRLAHNIAWLYGVQIASYCLPLITIPYLARVLGAAGWGLVAFAQAFAGYVILVGEYGFNLSATREVARHRESRVKLSEILAGVLGAKSLLAVASIAVALALRHWVAIFRTHPDLLWAAVFFATAQAFSMLWYFQGLERMRLAASLDIGAKTLATLGVLVSVRGPDDGWKVLMLQATAGLLPVLVALALAYRELPFHRPNWNLTLGALRMGWSMFLFRGAVSLYTVGNAFILGFFAPPQVVGYYAGGEKVCRAFLGLFNPVSQALFPRLSHLVHSARAEATHLARLGLAVMGGGGTILGLLVFAFARPLVHLVLGQGFNAAIPVVRMLALLLPLVALSNVLGIQWMLPLGMDRQFNAVILAAGIINLGLAVMLASRLGALGMACAVVGAESFVTGAFYVLLRRRHLEPTRSPAAAGEALCQATQS